MKILGMSSRKVILPDFSLWKEKSIKVAGLTFAPYDFYIVEKGTGRLLNQFFSYPEAMECEEKVLAPNGWRLPTKEEWGKVAGGLGGDADDLCRHLGIECNGFISSNSMDKYHQSFYAYDFCRYSRQIGCYWSRDKLSFCSDAFYLKFYDRGVCVITNTIWDGFSIRAVSLK